jgi:UDP-N-acetylglucosamine 3-dehydrogenase
MDRVRYATIGCGGIAHMFHLPELARIPEAEFIVACDLRENRARLTAEKFAARHWTTDYRKVLERDDVDAVIVATYHPTHAPIACEVLAADKHVLVQKPLATRMEDADRMVEAAAQSSRKTYCLPFLWTPEFGMAVEMIRSGQLGKIIQLRARTAHGGPESYYCDTQKIFAEQPETCPFFLKHTSQQGALFDMGVYSVAALTGLAGSAVRVTGAVKTLDKQAEVDDTASLLIEMESGAIAVAETTWCQATGGEEVSVYGTEGTMVLNPWRHTLRVYRKQPEEGWFEPKLPSPAEAAAHRHFIDCILKNQPPRPSPEHARHTIEIMLSAVQSYEDGRWATVRSRMP